jgi:hypothetical protein
MWDSLTEPGIVTEIATQIVPSCALRKSNGSGQIVPNSAICDVQMCLPGLFKMRGVVKGPEKRS